MEIILLIIAAPFLLLIGAILIIFATPILICIAIFEAIMCGILSECREMIFMGTDMWTIAQIFGGIILFFILGLFFYEE